MTTDVQTTAKSLAKAVHRHAEAVAGTLPKARQKSGRALVKALDASGIAVANSGNELPEEYDSFDGWLGEEDGVEHPEPEPDGRERLALFTRTDLAVTNHERLGAAATQRLAECCGDTVNDVDAVVAHPADAVSHLVGHHPTTIDPDSVEDFGLDLLSWTSITIAGVSADNFDEDPLGPLLAEHEQN